ncbi:MAG: endonuclease/exonuclease/phosphatase family protein [Paracoccaceae bacterium]
MRHVRPGFLSMLTVALAMAGAFVVAGYAGALHPLGDSFSVLRVIAGLVTGILGLAALLLRARLAGALGLMLAGVAAGPILLDYRATAGPGTGPVVTVYSKNLWAPLPDAGPLLDDIAAVAPDIVLLQEVSTDNNVILRQLAGSFPHQHLCPFSRWSGIAILSRWPLSQTACSDERALALARATTPQGELWLGSVHLPWPYPHTMTQHIESALAVLGRVQGPAIVGGDFNMPGWGRPVARIAEASGTQRVGPYLGSFSFGPFSLPIDTILSTGSGIAERRPLLGSDHNGIVARVRP